MRIMNVTTSVPYIDQVHASRKSRMQLIPHTGFDCNYHLNESMCARKAVCLFAVCATYNMHLQASITFQRGWGKSLN